MKDKTVVCIVGLPLSGKTSLGEALREATGEHFIDIDDGPAHCAPPQENNPYHDEESKARERNRMITAYTVLHAAVSSNLEFGRSIIVSATYSRASTQDFLKTAVDSQGGSLKVIWCGFNDTPEEIERRVNARVKSGARGGCRSVTHYLDDKARFVPFETDCRIKVNTSESIATCVAQALAFVSS